MPASWFTLAARPLENCHPDRRAALSRLGVEIMATPKRFLSQLATGPAYRFLFRYFLTYLVFTHYA